jgi:hypothetical protein
MKFLLQHLDGLIVVQYGLEYLKLDPLLNEWTGHSPIEHAHLPWLAHIHTEDRAKLMPGLKITRPRQLGPIEMTVRLIQPGSQNHTLGTAMLGVFSVSGQTLILLSSQLGQSRMGRLEPFKDDTI